MRVLFLTSAWPTAEVPAAGTFVREHALAAAAYADVAVVHLSRRHGFRRMRVERLAHEPLPAWRVEYPYRPLPVSLAAHAAAAVAGYRAARFDPDVIHAHFFLAGAPAVALGRALRKPVAVTEQWSVFLPEDPMRLSAPARLVAKLTYEGAQIVLPVSRALQRGIEASGIHPRFRIVPNVVDPDLFHPADERREGLLAVGLLYDAKGFDVLLEALARLPGERLRLVGDGPLRAQLEEQARHLGIADRVAFHGAVPKAEVAELMRRARLLVVPSRFETSCAVAIEALASATPVVASDVAALPELLEDGGGLTARPGDPDDFARRIGEALAHDFAMDAVSLRIRERHSPRHVGAELGEIYRELASAA